MTEKLFHFIWKFGYFNHTHLTTTSGETVSLIARGTVNTNQGPDFNFAKVQIGGVLFAGSVELHLKTSDWLKHGHEKDVNYRNVVLHVVFQHDRHLPHAIPVLELQPHISSFLIQHYNSLMNAGDTIACGKDIGAIAPLTWAAWKERLVAERLERKAATMLRFLKETTGHWEESFWWLLARGFGMKVNADAFEAIARSIPYSLLLRHKGNIHQLEALLFGQAGLLVSPSSDPYPQLLQREYEFLKRKYGLKSTFTSIQFLRMRPANFPSLRLAQLAMLVHTSQNLFSHVLEAQTYQEVFSWLNVTANDFWHYHYRFGEPSGFKPKRLGPSAINSLIINTLIPVLFAYGLHKGQETYKEKAVLWLQGLPPEINATTSSYRLLDLENKSAFDSQALIQLKNEYCQSKRCLECAVGNAVLKRHPLPA